MGSEASPVPESNDLPPTKSGVKTGYNTVNGHISQIPGLSPTISAPSEEKTRGRRAGVSEGDSDYVKLAKQGGHKGLLWHEETIAFKPDEYKPPDWFCNASGDNSKPSEDKKSPRTFQPLEAPFGTDTMSSWERDGSHSNNMKKQDNNVHRSQVEKLQSPNQYHVSSKFRRIVFDKRPAPVDMSKLLSFGYAEDNEPIAKTDVSN